MKLKSKRGFIIHDTKRSAHLQVKANEEFQLDETLQEEMEQIIQLLQGKRAYVSDETLLPPSANYLVKRSIGETRADGILFLLTAGQTVRLNQEDATRFLMDGTVDRENERDWSPRHLITGAPLKGMSVKKMFDDLSEKPNFATDSFKRERRG